MQFRASQSVRSFKLMLIGMILLIQGCTPFQRQEANAVWPNPVQIPQINPDILWEQLVDVVSDDFRIEREERIRCIGDIYTEGYLETAPEIGATVLEPWDQDSASGLERVEATLQTIRRRILVRVVPVSGGYTLEVTALKELEDLQNPVYRSSGQAIFRNDAPRGSVEPVLENARTIGWIPKGRDVALEQQILRRLMNRLRI
ncbi:Hypothetical protein PBC10988_7330 [Planctomycetales bacterium 10988]|nr:Hypothetical protein PBC10988_7330 [Planctomycetales bacterium 10988]